MKQFWTDGEIAKLRELYPVTPMKQLETIFNRDTHKIYNKAFALGLKKDSQYLATEGGRFTGHLSEKSIRHQFKKGHEPFNKGMKGWSAKGTEAGEYQKVLIGHYDAFNAPRGFKQSEPVLIGNKEQAKQVLLGGSDNQAGLTQISQSIKVTA